MQKLNFKTNVLLKNIIGKDLINNDNIAVLELVKNAFDAGSKKVDISFQNILTNDDSKNKTYGSESSRILIQDWGSGMGEAEIKDRWLNIAYSEKKNSPTQNGRRMAGAKGIGRFSCDRLGRFLDLYSRKKGGKYFHVSVDWKLFEAENEPDKRIESIDIAVSELNEKQFQKLGKFKPFNNGTIIVISRLRSQWDAPKLRSLRQYLERLLNPNQEFSSTPFILDLQAPEFDSSVNGEIHNQVFSRLEFTSTAIESAISADGKTIDTILRDKGRVIFELKERNNNFKLLKNIRVYIFYLNPYGKAYFKRITGHDKIAFGSIFLFINGFRISPYGDEKDDWLGLDRHKSQAYGRNLGTREIVGRIEIDDPDGDYKIVSSREGIVRDARTEQIMDRDGFYYLAHKRLESYVVDGLTWDSVPKEALAAVLKKTEKKNWRFSPADEVYSLDSKQKRLQVLEALSSTLNIRRDDVVSLTLNTDLIDELGNQEREKAEQILSQFSQYGTKFHHTTARALEQVKRVIAAQEKQIATSRTETVRLHSELSQLQEQSEQVKKENLFLRSAISTDSKDVMALQHQIGLSSKSIEIKLRELKAALERRTDTQITFKILNGISLENRKIRSISRFVTKANFSLETRWIEKDIVQFIREYIENVYQEYREFKINNTQIEVEVRTNGIEWVRQFTPLEIIIVIDNLLDNARKAGASKVVVEFAKNRSELCITVSDNGKGIPAKNLQRIFEFGFTTTDGSGIGLAHVQDILKKMDGVITPASEPGQGALFRITIPK